MGDIQHVSTMLRYGSPLPRMLPSKHLSGNGDKSLKVRNAVAASSKKKLHRHCAVTAPSLCCHCAVAAPSLHHHRTLLTGRIEPSFQALTDVPCVKRWMTDQTLE